MSNTEKYESDILRMPDVLRQLLDAELAAGNEIVEVFHCHPAPPAGACFRLARPVTTRPRASAEGIEFYDRNSSSYSGEFTDAKRFFFIIEPPNPPPPEPDMDAIREAMNRPSAPAPPKDANDMVGRFRESMTCTYDRWREGIGYDLEAIANAAPEELVTIENLLLAQGVHGWRDVEALAALDSPQARVSLKRALSSGNAEIITAILRKAPHLISKKDRTKWLVQAIDGARAYEGLTGTLEQVEEFHPPEVIDALKRNLLSRDGGTAVSYAAMLMYLHGKAKSAFDWDQRPFFLRFNTSDPRERRRVYEELCARIDCDA